METIKQVLMRRDRLSAAKAQEMIEEARIEAASYFSQTDARARDPEEILHEDFSLEPDWVWELI